MIEHLRFKRATIDRPGLVARMGQEAAAEAMRTA